MDTWQELTIEVDRESEEATANILIELGSQGVAIDDSADYLGQVDQYGELFPEVEQSERVKITGYYPDSVDIEAVAAKANERLAELDDFGLETGDIQLTQQELAEQDWADNWKKYFEPARITHDLTIVTTWTEYEATAGEKIIKLDTGMAFGTWNYPYLYLDRTIVPIWQIVLQTLPLFLVALLFLASLGQLLSLIFKKSLVVIGLIVVFLTGFLTLSQEEWFQPLKKFFPFEYLGYGQLINDIKILPQNAFLIGVVYLLVLSLGFILASHYLYQHYYYRKDGKL